MSTLLMQKYKDFIKTPKYFYILIIVVLFDFYLYFVFICDLKNSQTRNLLKNRY